jgi:hypothetical protein
MASEYSGFYRGTGFNFIPPMGRITSILTTMEFRPISFNKILMASL